LQPRLEAALRSLRSRLPAKLEVKGYVEQELFGEDRLFLSVR